MSEKKVAVDRLQGNIMDGDYFKVPIEYCMLLNKPCQENFMLDEQAYYKEGVEAKPPFDCRVCLRSKKRRTTKMMEKEAKQ
jgi:hypothetical protein